jgi:hypothetical protein
MACGGGWADGKRRKASIEAENGGIPGRRSGGIDFVCGTASAVARGNLPARALALLLTNGKSKTPACEVTAASPSDSIAARLMPG